MSRIAQNLVILYIQQIIYILLGIFSSRYLLKFLGVDDYGLYGLVGSIVTTVGALKIIFTSSVQRFINIENVKPNNGKANLVFTYGIVLHIGLSILFVIITETAGLIAIPNLNIDSEQLAIAYWLLQFIIIASFFEILAIPYDALIIANEQIYVFSIISVISQTLKFSGIFLLTVSPFNRVLTYAAIVLILNILTRFASSTYCKLTFKKTARFNWEWDKNIFKEMCFFSGWNFFGNISYSFINEGLNILLNIFGGVALNAARSIAFQVRSALSTAISQMFVGFRPRIMSSYGKKDYKSFTQLSFFSGKIAFCTGLILGLPLVFFGQNILQIWLTVVPANTYTFICIIVIYVCIRAIHDPIDTAYKSYGNIKLYQITECLITLLTLPLAYIFLHLKYPYYLVFVALLITETLNLITVLCLAYRQFNFPSWQYAKELVIPAYIIILLYGSIYFLCNNKIAIYNNAWQLLVMMALLLILNVLVCITIIFNKSERALISSVIFTKLKSV